MTEIRSESAPSLRLFDAVNIVVGIIIGAGIFGFPPLIFSNVPDVATGFAAWGLGAVVAIIGSLCYAELAGAYPTDSGEYEYLSRAYAPGMGFAFAWAQLTVIRTGASIAAIAYVFGMYAKNVIPFGPATSQICVVSAIVVLTIINAFGIQPGRRTQNLLTMAKILGLGSVVAAGVIAVFQNGPNPELTSPPNQPSFAFAMVLVLYAYSGWHEAAYIVGDLHNRQRNFPRAILYGVGTVAVVYFAVNLAYIAGLGIDGVRNSKAVAADLVKQVFGVNDKEGAAFATRCVAILVMITTLGAVNGMILTGSRFFATFGGSHPGFGWLSGWRTRRDAPLIALIAQAAISLFMVALVEYGEAWRGLVRQLPLTSALNLKPPPPGADPFETLVACTAPVFWLFFLLTGLSLSILRFRDPERSRPFHVPLFPLTPLLFCAACVFMFWQSSVHAWNTKPAEVVVVLSMALLGVPVYLWTWWRRRARVAPNPVDDK